jgi:segregation and condensation protein B
MIRIPDRDDLNEPGSVHEGPMPGPLPKSEGSREVGGEPPLETSGAEIARDRIPDRMEGREEPTLPEEGQEPEESMAEAGPTGEEEPLEEPQEEVLEEGQEESQEELQAAAFQEISEVELGQQRAGRDAIEVPTFPKELCHEDQIRLQRTLEALLFASTEALSPARLSEVVGVSIVLVREALDSLEEELTQEQRPYRISEHGGGFRLYTRQEYYPFLLRLRSLKKVEKLTPAALETLAIVAYRQPVIRSEVEAIRGVKVGPMLRALLDRKLVKVVGRAEVPGAPLQYGTTQNFLDRFGLKAISELPSLKEFKQGRI